MHTRQKKQVTRAVPLRTFYSHTPAPSRKQKQRKNTHVDECEVAEHSSSTLTTYFYCKVDNNNEDWMIGDIAIGVIATTGVGILNL